MRRTLLRLLPVLLASALAAACADAPTVTPADQPAELGFSLNLAGTDINLLVVEVTAPDIKQPLVYNVGVQNGMASAHLEVPPGPARTISIRAYDWQRQQTHEGSSTVDVKPGGNQAVNVMLSPAPGRLPITVKLGSLVVMMRAVDGPNAPTGEYMVGTSSRFEAVVTTPDGTPVPGATVRWASLNPGVASVREDGTVTAHNEGATEIAATYNGFGASIPVAVTARTDFYAPTLNGTSFEQPTVAVPASGNKLMHLTVRAIDDVSGIASIWVEIRGVNVHWQGWNCSLDTPVSPGVYDCVFALSSTATADDYVVAYAQLTDHAGNTVAYTKADLAARGLSARLTVTR